ncbi:F-box/kelch-repeat-like protein [Cinnamomum micranthum f. kanehirae]|uniref:F-box/kelch-repeat-like protein n=1 Tax=Cinnamomum micranthum f. kanehirae TaxID=337451 RepID=A0A443N1S1_9MAGN|nr:F-box/kelch-repeat-like protein [Cinnamomum micranthum f. kanehirae]
MALQKSAARGNILFMDDKEIASVKKMTLTQETSHETTSGALRNVLWSDLPRDLLVLVTQRLTLADHVRISTTCKSWQWTAPSFLSSKRPILLFIENQSSNFYDPFSRKICVTYIPELLDATYHYSKDGWLLLSQQNNLSQVFFLNPFTNEKITLTHLNLSNLICPSGSKNIGPFTVSFSAPPTSQDCIIFLVLTETFPNIPKRTTRVFTFSLRDETVERSMFTLTNHLHSRPTTCKNTLYFHRAFYYLNTRGTLAVTKFPSPTKTKVTTYVVKPTGISLRKYDYCYLVESQGEILSIFKHGKQIQVFQLDRPAVFEGTSTEKWIEVESLGDTMLFLDWTTSLCTVVRGKKKSAVRRKQNKFF